MDRLVLVKQLAYKIANEMKAKVKVISGPAMERQGDLASVLTNLAKGDVLFIDEIHRLRPAVEEILYSAMEDYAIDIMLGIVLRLVRRKA